MFSFGRKCDRCRGTGVKEHDSYHLGADFFLFALEMVVPVVFIFGLLFVWYLFVGFEAGILLPYAPYLICGAALATLVAIWKIPNFLKFIVFSKCEACRGIGRIKE